MLNNESIENLNSVELNPEELENIAGGKSNGSGFVKTTGNVNIRKGPGLDYGTMGTVPEDVYLSYLGSTQKDDRGVKWYKVNYNGKVGWISSRYSKLV